MNKIIHYIAYLSITSSSFIFSHSLSANENQLPGLLKFANEYEEKKRLNGIKENQPYDDEESGIQLPQLKLKILNQKIQALSINERQYKIRIQQQEKELLQAKMNKINDDLSILLNKQNMQLKLQQQEKLQSQIEESLNKSKNDNLNLSNNIKLLSQRLEESEKAQKIAIEQALSLKQPIAVEKLKGSEALKQAYAAGIAIGQDAMTIHKENQSFGQDMDKKAYLAGITDAIEGRSLLSPTELQTALIASNSAVTKNRDAKKEEQTKLAKNFLSNWSKQKGVVSDPLGYSYKINYVGQGKIQENDTVSIVVKESLLDGTVVSDMDLQDKSLTLPLDNYPPLFQSAIKHLQNHGEITFIVPPELAYGDEGYPPAVPPGASIMYTLRIADIKPTTAR
ncbi:FKBP-type peptidyl-prolyl cis-trans isomerase N-terminal domain-containing protein [Providencia stuartii]|uniref:FKBP-type peptidyl-prolyl cis-trans isomerase N-terminal domain-containing protein n=1 Tax=Providencia stuartii TaxID=588 RepID=UPI0023E321EA|nr:FKBP-type peptidyl-prolyl cis-trans isomerase N-terminal domain-containing protein [Providencia stuartii]ELR5142313.1 FKBP-type peptidyl-prolyl cis-trans isomerase [Providencia stuartii]WER21629.1 FKBP-type peptidyl-prolyl cis-trans isomerase N-terminal domain-containing protein [Providencia stuartii]WER25750.1 FKBP-type peptidyl-prolyl cis-trans isomerase N-terminal domain-containing protein [Providencia stuartii]WER29839.1 FKBP-type peptidyl-prolyl cis-trans isomerase N-terminal domain-con